MGTAGDPLHIDGRLGLAIAQVWESSDDEALLDALADLTRCVLEGDPFPSAGAIELIADRGAPTRVRMALVLLLALSHDPRAEELLRQESLSDEDGVALAALKGLILQRRKGELNLSDGGVIRSLWRGVFLDEALGRWANAGYFQREMDRGHVARRGRAMVPSTAWDISYGQVEGNSLVGAFYAVARGGGSSAARAYAINTLPDDEQKRTVCQSIVDQDSAPPIVRAVAYEQSGASSLGWQSYVAAARRETNPRVLAGLCTMLSSTCPKDRQSEIIPVLEGIAQRAGDDAQLADRLGTALSLTDTRAGLDALARIAKEGTSPTLRRAAAMNIGYCACTTPLAEERAAALRRLADDPSQEVSTSAILAMAHACGYPYLNAPMQARVDAALTSRARELSNSPSVDEMDRERLVDFLRGK